jgi:site-specific recombinase XerD
MGGPKMGTAAERIKETTRIKLLKEQFKKYFHYQVEFTNMRAFHRDLDRICLFIYENTDITYLKFIQPNVLIEYLTYHRYANFNQISFSQAVKDVKRFLFVCHNCKYIESLELDLSVHNYNLWKRI